MSENADICRKNAVLCKNSEKYGEIVYFSSTNGLQKMKDKT